MKDLLAYFRLIINPKDVVAVKRIINYPARGIGNTTLQKIVIAANNNNCSLYECLNNPLLHPNIGVNKGTLNKLQNFTILINSFGTQLQCNAYDLAVNIAKTSSQRLQRQDTEGVSRYENIQELLNAIKVLLKRKMRKSRLLSHLWKM